MASNAWVGFIVGFIAGAAIIYFFRGVLSGALSGAGQTKGFAASTNTNTKAPNGPYIYSR